MCEEISPGRIVPWDRSSALPTFPQRYDFAQRVELWDEEIELGVLVEIVGDQFLLARELQSCDTRDCIGEILYRSRHLEDEETLRRERIGIGPQLQGSVGSVEYILQALKDWPVRPRLRAPVKLAGLAPAAARSPPAAVAWGVQAQERFPRIVWHRLLPARLWLSKGLVVRKECLSESDC